MARSTKISGALLCALLVLANCGGGGGGGNGGDAGGGCGDTPDVAGHWTGTITDRAVGAGTLDLTITQDACELGGDGTVCFANGATCGSGVLVGIVEDGSVDFSIDSRDSSGTVCTVIADGALVTAEHVTGTYDNADCNRGGGGTFDITRSP
jgi:hypothetical protein